MSSTVQRGFGEFVALASQSIGGNALERSYRQPGCPWVPGGSGDFERKLSSSLAGERLTAELARFEPVAMAVGSPRQAADFTRSSIVRWTCRRQNCGMSPRPDEVKTVVTAKIDDDFARATAAGTLGAANARFAQ